MNPRVLNVIDGCLPEVVAQYKSAVAEYGDGVIITA
jgi:hypothetical protein